MTAPLRTNVVGDAVVEKDSYTIREAVEWFKTVYMAGKQVEVLAEQEQEYMNKKFGEVVKLTAKEDKLPLGPLGQFIASVAIQELAIALAKEALEE